MIRDEACFDAMMDQQMARMSRVLCQHDVDGPQHVDRTQRHVAEVTDRRADDVERTRPFIVRMMWRNRWIASARVTSIVVRLYHSIDQGSADRNPAACNMCLRSRAAAFTTLPAVSSSPSSASRIVSVTQAATAAVTSS